MCCVLRRKTRKRVLFNRNSICCFFFCSEVERGDEIYSLCQVPPAVVIEETVAVDGEDEPASPEPLESVAPVAVNESPAEKVRFQPECLVDSTTFLLPAGDGPVQLDSNQLTKSVETTAAAKANIIASCAKKKPACSESPKATTTDTFAPRTKDMSKGFLTFSDDDTGLTSKCSRNRSSRGGGVAGILDFRPYLNIGAGGNPWELFYAW